jgi:hypothetical protein
MIKYAVDNHKLQGLASQGARHGDGGLQSRPSSSDQHGHLTWPASQALKMARPPRASQISITGGPPSINPDQNCFLTAKSTNEAPLGSAAALPLKSVLGLGGSIGPLPFFFSPHVRPT